LAPKRQTTFETFFFFFLKNKNLFNVEASIKESREGRVQVSGGFQRNARDLYYSWLQITERFNVSSDRLLHLSTHLTRTMSMAPKERNNDHNDSEDTKKKRGRHLNEGTDFLSFCFNRNNRQN